MKQVTLLLVAIFLCAFTTNFATDINGNWQGKVAGQQGEMALTFNFIVSGDTLTGSVKSEMGELPLLEGKFNGDSLSFKIDLGGNMIEQSGKISGDKIILSAMDFPSTIELARAVSDASSKIDGKWLGKVSSPNGDMELTFTFKVAGDTLTGTNKSEMGEMALQNGKVNGDEFSFDIDLGGNLVSHKCKLIDNDTVNVKAAMMGNDFEMTLKRVQ